MTQLELPLMGEYPLIQTIELRMDITDVYMNKLTWGVGVRIPLLTHCTPALIVNGNEQGFFHINKVFVDNDIHMHNGEFTIFTRGFDGWSSEMRWCSREYNIILPDWLIYMMDRTWNKQGYK